MSTFKKAWSVFNYSQKRVLFLIFALMLIAMILETLSIGVILPLLSIFLKNEIDPSFLRKNLDLLN